jgi:T-complex protein 1 subunit alpha
MCFTYLTSLLCSMGLDLAQGIIRNNLECGVIEPAMSKVKIIQVGPLSTLLLIPFLRFLRLVSSSALRMQFATEAAITILRIDDMIKLTKEESGNEE